MWIPLWSLNKGLPVRETEEEEEKGKWSCLGKDEEGREKGRLAALSRTKTNYDSVANMKHFSSHVQFMFRKILLLQPSFPRDVSIWRLCSDE